MSGCRNTAVISATSGLADRLVAGEIDGENHRIDRAARRVAHCGGAAARILSDEEALAVGDLAISAERHFGAPQDIEWAFAGDRLHLLQARPMTALPDAPAAGDAYVLFDNSNIVESYPGIVSPLTFSFARHVYASVYRVLTATLGVTPATIHTRQTAFENLLGQIEGRVYYNLLNWYRILALLPGFSLNREFMESMMGVGQSLPAEVAESLAPPRARGWRRAVEFSLVARVGVGLAWSFISLPRRIRRFLARFEAAMSSHRAQDRADLAGLAAEYRALEAALLERWDAPLVNDLACMIAFGASRKLLKRWAGDEGLRLHNDVLIGQGDIVSAEPAQRIRVMARLVAADEPLKGRLAAGDSSVLRDSGALASALNSYIAKFGDRCVGELKLESMTLADDPAPLVLAVAAAARRPEVKDDVRVDSEAVLARLFQGRPLRRAVARRMLRWTKARLRDRENLRFERTRLFGRIRQLMNAIGRALAAAGWLDDSRQIYMLTIDEALGAADGVGAIGDLAAVARQRERAFKRFAALPDPPERIEFGGNKFAERPVATAASSGAELRTRVGIGCSRGIVRGAAKVVRDPRAESVLAGEILVARHTDPGWIALFATAAGIVVERGSLLSHSAIVARELGIPCVVGVKGALDWIATGTKLEIDGGTGRVGKIDE